MASFRHCTSARVEDMNLCGTLLSHLSERWDSLMDMWVERLLISAYCDRHEYHEVMGCRHRGTRLQVARWLFLSSSSSSVSCCNGPNGRSPDPLWCRSTLSSVLLIVSRHLALLGSVHMLLRVQHPLTLHCNAGEDFLTAMTLQSHHLAHAMPM